MTSDQQTRVHGREHGQRPDEGVEGNSRLTAATGAVLTLLLAAEGLTILRIRQLVTVHVFLGLLLLAPVALKIGATGYRFARYYTRRQAYVRRGPPPLLMRVLAPFLVAATVALFASGVALLTRGPGSAGLLLTAHKASFIVWVVLMAVHFLGHVAESLALTARDVRGPSAPPGRGLRQGAVVLALLVGVGMAAAVTPSSAWAGHADRGRVSGPDGRQ